MHWHMPLMGDKMTEVVPPAPEAVMQQTYNVLIGLWMNNFAENLPFIRSGKSITDIPRREGEPCICVGAGPSLASYQHLLMIKKHKWKHPILVCDKVFVKALKKNLNPYVVASADGSPLIADYYRHALIKNNKTFYAALNSTIHPEVRKLLPPEQTYWFVSILDSLTTPEGKPNRYSITYLLYLLSGKKAAISSIGNVGSFLWNLAAEWKCDPIILVGYDFSEQVKDKSEAVYFNAFTNMFLQQYLPKDSTPSEDVMKEAIKKAQDSAADMHQVEKNPDFGTYYLVNPMWKRYREILKEHIIANKNLHIINATGNGCLHTEAIQSPNFEALNLKDVLKKYG